VVDIGNGVLVVIDLDMLLELPVLVPLLNLDKVLESNGTPVSLVTTEEMGAPCLGGQSTYP
jgi:hypothetical protein